MNPSFIFILAMAGAVKAVNDRGKSLWIGIQGGSCAGKTVLAQAIAQRLGAKHTFILPLDLFYLPLSKQPAIREQLYNFDHPSSVDWELIRKVVHSLRSGKHTAIPVIDFVSGNCE